MFYYAFLDKENNSTYEDTVNEKLQKWDVQEVGRILKKELGKRYKILTNEGKIRKVKICMNVRKCLKHF